MPAETSEPTVGELLGTLAQSTATLMRQEVRLATTEVSQKAVKVSHAVAMMAMGGAALVVAVLLLAFALVAGVATWIPMWLSAALIGAAFLAIGAVALLQGRSSLRTLDPVPRETVRTIKDDGTWIKEQVR